MDAAKGNQKWYRKISFPWSIRKKMLLLFSCAFVPVLMLTVIDGIDERQYIIAKAEQELINITGGMSAHQEQIITATRQLLSTLAQLSEVQRHDSKACDALFARLNKQNPQYTNISLAEPGGRMIASSLTFKPGSVNLADRRHFREAVRTLDFSAGEYIVGRVSKVPSLNFTYPVLDKKGKLVAVVIAAYNLNEYKRYISLLHLPAGSAMSVADHQGIQLFHWPENAAAGIGSSLPQDSLTRAKSSSHGIFRRVSNDGVKRIYAYRTMSLREGISPYLYMLVGFDEERVLHDANTRMLIRIAVVGVLVLLVAVLFWFFVSLALIKPIRDLSLSSRAISRGHRGVRTGLPYNADEIGQLAYSFDAMAAMLDIKEEERDKAEHALRLSNMEMEKRIQGRTNELSNANATLTIEIQKHKQAEEALRQSEAVLNTVFNSTPVGLCIMKDRIFKRINKAWLDNLGYAEADLIGKTPRMLYESEEEYERVGRELFTDIPGCGQTFIRARNIRKSGEIRDVILKATLLQLVDKFPDMTLITLVDVTENNKIMKELENNRRQLAGIIEFFPEATCVVDKEGVVIAWNLAMETLTGIKKEAMIGKGNREYAVPFYGDRRPTLLDLALHPDEEWEKKYTTIQRIGDTIFGAAYTPNIPPGDVHLFATASVLRDNKGDIIAAIKCLRNDTERKKLEERLNRAEKMEALGTLAGGVAHDLNNVLGILVGYSEILQEELAENSKLGKYAGNVLQSGIRASAIIQDLLTLARRGVTVAEVINLNKLVSDCLRTAEFEKIKSYHQTVKIWAELEDGLLNIKGSPVHLNKTIMNLVLNAVEAIPVRGEVTIRTENRYLDRPFGGYDKIQEGEYAVLIVSDTGSGISAADLGKIFEPFYTKKVMGRSGTGLGLAVVWGTVKDHNGYIDVVSEEGKGTVFSLYFPVTREEAVKMEKTVSPAAFLGKGETVLVVDDIKEQRELAQSMLGRLGYRVESVASGEEAVEYLRSKKADLVVLDMIMDPGIDGLETYRMMLEINPEQKAVIVSGFSETDRVREVQKMGAGAFVRKPYILEKIGIAIRRELDGK